MGEFKIRESAYRLMDLIWRGEPIGSMELAKRAKDKLGWSRTTTYNVLRYMVEIGICVNENSTVRSLVSREQVQRDDSERVVQKRFEGSLPKFVASFADSKSMTREDAEEIIRILERFKDE